ncbi:protein ENHANCED DOWNY MILDEW 2 isoform X2 [Physcomitrium patens]|uniref:Zinc finger PHD-type domain-containing protein n=1 Tax=Physcomitrium patens TaxID=3218 RepID=A0A7I4BAS9_PHYPA|nr:protein ENHANCED DOWNY MILDEW 2-like isoform X2 [Physcomitrium patens]|eukprot:XP_024400871.1 protein ENHANCED DOWNY MILDEW 2-like isoform X2 [Physcomitrella patens]
MARASGRYVMTGDKDGDYRMVVEFEDDLMPDQVLRKDGYYLGERTKSAMIVALQLKSEQPPHSPEFPEHKEEEDKADVNVVNVGIAKVEDMRTNEPQSSTESLKPPTPGSSSTQAAMGFLTKEPGTSQPVGWGQPEGHDFKGKAARAVGRAPIGHLRRDSSDDEVEVEIVEVDAYTIVDDENNKPVSLCDVPLEFEGRSTKDFASTSTEVYLHGKSGGEYIMRSIRAWKLAFPGNGTFNILVKINTQKGDTNWVKLGKPQFGYKETAESVFCIAKFLALLKEEPHASGDLVGKRLDEWDVPKATIYGHLSKRFAVVEQYINLDSGLKDSDALSTFRSVVFKDKAANSGKRMLSDDSSDEDGNLRVKRHKKDFGNTVDNNEVGKPEDEIMHDSGDEVNFVEDEKDVEIDEASEELGDSLCIICDDGGELLCCDGPCMRSFHAIRDPQHNCETLKLTKSAIAKMVGQWLCKNCVYKKHQCYVCGELGDSDEDLGVKREVFVCDVACCGKFYHPTCVANEIALTEDDRKLLATNIQAGVESFACPLHRCKKCGKGEDSTEESLLLARCRRCPATWHKKCLPSGIRFAEETDDKHPEVRAWAFGDVYKRFIIYCTKHKIMKDLGTPKRNHVKFPRVLERPGDPEVFKQLKSKVAAEANVSPSLEAKASSSLKPILVDKSAKKKHSGVELLAKEKRPEEIRELPLASPPRLSISADMLKKSEDAAKRVVLGVIAESAQKVTDQSVKLKLALPSIYRERRGFSFMKQGHKDSILKAARIVLEKLRSKKITVEEAKAMCNPSNINRIELEEDYLKTFLAPTLYGDRYVSYGRHFTKLEKLRKVVRRLHPLIWDHDTIVDFSCGDNSFSRLLHNALSDAGKTHLKFKNFDIFPPKDTFEFERKDWFDTKATEFGSGENLVIGLNPPFPFAEKFVAHALMMQPRLLVLITPPLKNKMEHRGYNCLEDDHLLLDDNSFYVPGSLHDQHMESLQQVNAVVPHFCIYVHKKFFRAYVPRKELLLSPTPSQPIRVNEKPVKPLQSSKPTSSLFIENPGLARPVSYRAQPNPSPNPRSSEKITRRSPQTRDPRLASRQPQHVPRREHRSPTFDPRVRDTFSPIGNLPNSRSSRWGQPLLPTPTPPPPPPPPQLHPYAHRPSQFLPHPYEHQAYNPEQPYLFPTSQLSSSVPYPHHFQNTHSFRQQSSQHFHPGQQSRRDPHYQHGTTSEREDSNIGGWID